MITFAELKNKAKISGPGVILEKYSDHKSRRFVRRVFFWGMVILFVVVLIAPTIPEYESLLPENVIAWFEQSTYLFRGLFVVLLSMWLVTYMIAAFYRSHYFRQTKVDFDVAHFAFNSPKDDVLFGFLDSEIGKYTMMRLGVATNVVKQFLDSDDRHPVRDAEMDIDVDLDTKFIGIKDYGHALYQADKSFAEFLTRHNIKEEVFLGALEWVDHDEWMVRNAERWWSRESLSRIQSIGRNWSFGKTYIIERFGNIIISELAYRNLGDKWRLHKEDVQKIESVLIKNSGANVLLVSPTTSIGVDVVASLGKMIVAGKIMPELEDRRIFVLDTALILSQSSDRATLEENVVNILAQANKAGNVVLALPQMPEFIEGAHKLDVDIPALFSEVLDSSNIQIIGIANQKGFHEVLETNRDMMQHFDRIDVADLDYDSGMRALQEQAHVVENRTKTFFTYQSLAAIVRNVERFFVGDTFSDKIVDILEEVANKAKQEHRIIISEEDVNRIVAVKTGIPQGSISEQEKTHLSSLEETLHERVIGQNEAISVIAKAMRRGRAGVTNPNRPIGSFLFLGPTGVGKTETTKALAENFFQSEDKIVRFDMSEYTGDDAVDKLIGGFNSKQTGTLAQKIIDNPYGVLLLDEFEKTTDKVMDLFLQILDEGQFTDARGHKVNARNLMIVATSNAASDLIYKASQNQTNLADQKDSIIDSLVSARTFRPELLNRFDSIVLFHSLDPEHLRQIAKLMLKKLDKRLSQKGIKIDINEDLLDYLVRVGNDRKFGARAMNRAISNEVEGLIADKIISGEIKDNSHVKFKVKEDGSGIEVATSVGLD
jgi:ATP-dependent Clp protease ATP-binding subunit ClpC